MTSRILIFLHRWSGILAAALIIVCGLTGSVLVFRDDLDRGLNADMLVVTPRASQLGVDDSLSRIERAPRPACYERRAQRLVLLDRKHGA